ncbi:hypothetical protein [Streptomyces sp. NPDC052225]|uniref:hypothetical protein n=1 Tax=Streptomyces sp. NPDC052225 TaxID=3154949 RepID=UPI00341EBE65
MTSQPSATNTEVVTAAVQIKTLTVSGKSMTQNIFRQLIKQPVINTAGGINGTPWGTINYHPDRCDDLGEHLHIVWQLGTELRRATAFPPMHAYHQHPLASEYIMARIAEGEIRQDGKGMTAYRDPQEHQISAQAPLRGTMFSGVVSQPFYDAWNSTAHPSTDYKKNQLRKLEEQYAKDYGSPLRPSAELAELLPVTEYQQSWRTLQQLPQLFIGR